MAKPLVTDELWALIAPEIPPEPPKPKGGRPRVPDRAALTGILFVLKTGIQWEDLPHEMGCGCGMTCWRRLRDWYAAGVWTRVQQILLAHLSCAHRINWARVAVDSASIPAPAGGPATGPNPTDRGKSGTKHHLAVDAQGIPLAVQVTAANRPDGQQLLALVDALPSVPGRRGRPRHRPDKVHADKAYDAQANRAGLRARGIQARIARRGIESGERLGRWRWVVERTISWLHRMRRLRIRYERRDDIHQAFLTLGAIMITWNFAQAGFC
jgi:transposase